jgi:hypothetical protein
MIFAGPLEAQLSSFRRNFSCAPRFTRGLDQHRERDTLNDADQCKLDVGDHRIEFGATFAQRGHNATRNRFTTKLSSRRQHKLAGTVKFCLHT